MPTAKFEQFKTDLHGRRVRFAEWRSRQRPGAVLKPLAYGVAAVGVGYGAKEGLTAWSHRNDPPPLDHSLKTTGSGDFYSTPNGGFGFVPSIEYLDAVAANGNNGGLDGVKGLLTGLVLDKPQTPEQTSSETKNAKMWDSITSPWLVLSVGGIIVLAKVLGKK